MKILLVALCLSLASSTTSTFIQSKLNNNIALALEDIYTYFLNSSNNNLNGFRGVLLSKAILEGTKPGLVELGRLRKMASNVVDKLQNNFLQTLQKTPLILQYLPNLVKWQKEMKFGTKILDKNYTNLYVVLQVHEFLNDIAYLSVNKTFLEKCLLEMSSGPDPNTNQCDTSPTCRDYLIDTTSIDSGYSATRRVHYLQMVRLMGCAQNDHVVERQIQIQCSYMIWEARNFKQYHLIDMVFDLLFEQITLCGMEGYSDFMQEIFFYNTLKIRSVEEGCYKQHIPIKQIGRKTVYKYICSDRTTGLAASVFALYLKYYSQRLHHSK